MLRSLQEIVDLADELAARFEDDEPQASDEHDADSLGAVRRAVLRRAEADREVSEAVRLARRDGLSWALIGSKLGTTGEAARQRYGARSPRSGSGELTALLRR